MDRFWALQENKEKVLDSIPGIVNGLQELVNMDIIVSGRIYDDGEATPAVLIPAGRIPAALNFQAINSLKSSIEEADDRIFPHLLHDVQNGKEHFLVISNDTDTIARALYYFVILRTKGMKLLWIQYSSGENLKYIPIHKMYISLGEALCKVILIAYILTGDDALNKVGTKKAAMVSDPVKYLSDFAVTEELCHAQLWLAEEYLVKVWAGANRKVAARIFDALRLSDYTDSKEAKPLETLPPTSSSVKYTSNAPTMLSET